MHTGEMSPLFPVSEIEVTYRNKVKESHDKRISDSKDLYLQFLNLWEEGKIDYVEQFKALYLNRANCVLGVFNVSTGGISETIADVRIIFGTALKLNASYVAVCHNHPSGNVKPSRADELLTQVFREAGRILHVKLLDHIIISRDRYYSFADEGAL